MPRRMILLALLAALFWSLLVLLFLGYFFMGGFDGNRRCAQQDL